MPFTTIPLSNAKYYPHLLFLLLPKKRKENGNNLFNNDETVYDVVKELVGGKTASDIDDAYCADKAYILLSIFCRFGDAFFINVVAVVVVVVAMLCYKERKKFFTST
jgi:hypothetical protein